LDPGSGSAGAIHSRAVGVAEGGGVLSDRDEVAEGGVLGDGGGVVMGWTF
jgi:hypothetical protein